MSEDTGLLVIEALEHAIAREAKPLAELVGYGTCGRCLTILRQARKTAAAHGTPWSRRCGRPLSVLSTVQYINAHESSTPVGDRGILAAILSVFGSDSGVVITSTKSATGIFWKRPEATGSIWSA